MFNFIGLIAGILLFLIGILLFLVLYKSRYKDSHCLWKNTPRKVQFAHMKMTFATNLSFVMMLIFLGLGMLFQSLALGDFFSTLLFLFAAFSGLLVLIFLRK